MRIEDMDFAKLRAFQLVATHGSLAAAATQLNLTIPAVSAKLKRLDDMLGVALFRRLPNGLALTPAGDRLLRDVTPLLQQAEQVMNSVQAQSNARAQETGTISIAMGGDYTSFFVPRLHKFLDEYPRVDIRMRVARTSDSLTALQIGEVDFCMGVYPRLPQGVSAKVVARTTMSLVKPARSNGPRLEPEGRLIVAPGSTAVRQLLRRSPLMAGRANVLECPTCQTAMELVALGGGSAVVHTLCASRHGARELTATDLGEETGLLQIVVAYRRGARRSSIEQAFFDHVTTT